MSVLPDAKWSHALSQQSVFLSDQGCHSVFVEQKLEAVYVHSKHGLVFYWVFQLQLSDKGVREASLVWLCAVSCLTRCSRQVAVVGLVANRPNATFFFRFVRILVFRRI